MPIRNDGTEAQKAFLDLMAKVPGTVVERFWDASDLRGLNKGRKVNDFAKPSDFLVTHSGRIHYAEVKSVQSAVSFPFSNIETSQRSAALRQARVGGPYNFYLFSYGLGQWFVMTAQVFAETIEAGRASIKFKELPVWNPSTPI